MKKKSETTKLYDLFYIIYGWTFLINIVFLVYFIYASLTSSFSLFWTITIIIISIVTILYCLLMASALTKASKEHEDLINRIEKLELDNKNSKEE